MVNNFKKIGDYNFDELVLAQNICTKICRLLKFYICNICNIMCVNSTKNFE